MADAARRIDLPASDYDADFHAWTVEQARLLRAGGLAQADIAHIAEEIEAVGGQDRSAIRNHMIRIVEHLLKLEVSPAADPRPSWRNSIDEARDQIGYLVELSPSLRHFPPTIAEGVHRPAAARTANAMIAHGELTPDRESRLHARRFTAEEILGDWWPDGS